MTEKKNLLEEIWGRSEKTWDKLKQKRAAKSLGVQAEQDLLELQDKIISNQEELEKSIESAKESKDWKSIREASLEVKLAEKELREASKLYEEFFNRKASDILED